MRKETWKKVLSFGLAATMMAAVGQPMGAAAQEATNLKIAIWGDDARKAKLEETLAPFCEENNVTVDIELVPVADYTDKLASQLGAGTAPDIFWLADSKETTFITAGWCAELRDVLEADPEFDFDDFYEDAINSTDYGDGGIYGVPFSFGPRGVLWNKTLFEDLGVKTPEECMADGTWTYETMFDLASQISKADSTKIGVKLWQAGETGNSVQAYADIISGNGAQLLNEDSTEFMLNSEAGIKTIQQVYDAMYTNGGHAKAGDDTAFISGNVAMAREPYSYMRKTVEGNVDFEWSVAPQPYGDAGKGGKIFTGYAYWLANAEGKNVDLAKQMIAFVSNKENQTAWTDTFLTPRTSVMSSDLVTNPGEGYPSPQAISKAFVEVIGERGLTAYRGTPKFPQLQDAVQQSYEMIWSGAYNVEEGIQLMGETVAPYLNKK